MVSKPFQGRTKSYTEIGISRISCSRCGMPSSRQWQVCANGNRFLGVCWECDVKLNQMTLTFMRVPGRIVLMRLYRQETMNGGTTSSD